MSEAYLIEATTPFRAGQQRHKLEAGLVLRERGGFRFFAANALFAAIENRLFRRPAEAERAAAALLAQDRSAREPHERADERETRRQDDAASLADPLALPPDWHGSPGLLALSFLPFDR